MQRLKFLNRWPKTTITLLGVSLIVVVGGLDYMTGSSVSCSIFYLVPISVAAWYGRRWAGLLLAVFCAAVWLAVDMWQVHYPSLSIHFWNAGVRLGIFVIVALLLSRLKRARDTLEDTVRQRTAALADSEAKYRGLYSSMNEGVALHRIVHDPTGRPLDYVIVDVNPAFEAITGISRERAIGAKASELYGTGEAPCLEIYAHVADSGEPARFETQLDPMRKWFRISVFSPEKGYFAAVFEDITERKQAEEALRQSEQRLSLHFQQTPLGVIEWDLGLRVVKWNPGAERVFGYPEKEAFGRHAGFIVPVGAREHVDGVWQRLLTHKGGQRSANENVTRDGHTILCEWYNTPLVNAQGEAIGVASLVRDVTEQELARRELVRKNRDLETLLYVSSHDLREPLRAIQSFANLLNSRYAGQFDEKGRDFVRRIVRGGDRMQRLIDDILVLSRAQRMVNPNVKVRGAAIVGEALDRLRAKVEATKAVVRVADDLPEFHADKTWAVHGVYNLIDNALKFTRPGQPPEIEIVGYSARLDGHPEIGIAVRDRGPGVAQEYAERIFDLFQRAVPREVEGTGAGLAIVRQIAEKHGGRTWVQPRPDGGSEFIITFGIADISERERV